ncbi:NAD-dependent epimerase/dehydratase family protein [Leptospira perdikensis]|uniref:NAD-dependent epimerase/dehydratase family protein n=1 Tax=Leptospira perdikensis TaxID=2484948 RepID=UPI001ABF9257|nr:NAD-dependent epimerase/dehydratase family protein [Leptospira perdikensis]
MDNPKLLVFGGTGFIGSHIVTEGVKRGLHVTCVSHKKKIQTNEHLSSILADLNSTESIKSILSKESFEYIIHAGGYIDHTHYKNGGEKVIQQHLNSLYSIVSNLDRTKLKRFIFLGSSDEYGNAKAPQMESIREKPISPYSFAKTAGSHFLQMLHKSENFPATIARLFLTYGPGQDDNRFLPMIIKGCLKDEEFPTSYGEQLRDFCYIQDTVDGIFSMLDSDEAVGEIFNLASGRKISIRSMIDKIVQLVGKGKPIYGQVPYRVGENMELYADITKAKEILNWEPKVSLDEGLKETIQFYKNA